MIEFDCPHCKNHLKVPEKYVGRQAKCRVCNGYLAVPAVDAEGKLVQLTPAGRIARLERVLHDTELRCRQYEADIATLHKKYLEARAEATRAGSLEETLELTQARLAEAQQLVDKLTQDLSSGAQSRGEVEAQLTLFSREVARLTADLECERASGLELQEALRRTQAGFEQFGPLRETLGSVLETLEGHATALKEVERALSELTARHAGLPEGGGVATPAALAAAPDLDRLLGLLESWKADVEAERSARREAEAAFDEMRVRAESAEARAELLATQLEAAQVSVPVTEAQPSEESLLRGKLEEKDAIVDRLTAELSAVSQQLGAYKATTERQQAEIQSLSRAVEDERAAKEDVRKALAETEARIRDLETKLEVMEQAGGIPSVTAGDEGEGEGLSFTPEVVDGDLTKYRDPMVDTLFRFLEPQS